MDKEPYNEVVGRRVFGTQPMSPLATLLWVVLVILLWVGVLAGVWAVLTSREEYPPEVSQSPTKE